MRAGTSRAPVRPPRPVRRHRERVLHRPWADAADETMAYLVGREVAEHLLARDPRWSPIGHPDESGVGGAYDRGLADYHDEHHTDRALAEGAMAAIDEADDDEAIAHAYATGYALGRAFAAAGDTYDVPEDGEETPGRAAFHRGLRNGLAGA